MSFPRFKHPDATESGINPAIVARVFNCDDLGDDQSVWTVIKFIDGTELEVEGRFEQVLNKLNHAQRNIVEVCQ